MKTKRPLAMILLLLGGAAASAPAAPASGGVVLPSPRDRWTHVQIDDIALYSDARPRVVEELARDLQTMRAAMGLATHLRVDAPLPTTVLVFDDEALFTPFVDATNGHPGRHLAGFFQPGRDGNYIAVGYTGLSASTEVLYHELTHYFVASTTPHVPVWLNEGLAEFFSTFARPGKKVLLGKPVLRHLQTLRSSAFIPLLHLFAVTRESKEYNENDRATLFYAESWAAVHYLILGNPQRQGQLGEFLGLLAAGKTTDEAFQSAFSCDYAQLEKELKAYIQRSLFPYLTLSLPELNLPPLAQPAPTAREDILFQLGAFLAASGRRNFAEAERVLHAGLESDPDHAASLALLGRLKEEQGAGTEATDLYQHALRAGPNDAVTYLLCGEGILEAATRGGVVPTSPAAPAVRWARGLFNASIKLNPRLARAYAELGATYVFDADATAPGIAALVQSLRMAPSQVDAAYSLAVLYARAGQVERATAVIERFLAHAPDPDLAREAGRAVEYYAAEAKERAASGGAGTPERPTAFPSGPSSTPAAPAAQGGGGPPDQGPLQAAERDKQQWLLYNEAIAKVNAGDYRGALEAIDKCLTIAGNQDLVREAKRLRGQLAARLDHGKK